MSACMYSCLSSGLQKCYMEEVMEKVLNDYENLRKIGSECLEKDNECSGKDEIDVLKNKIIKGYRITKQEAYSLIDADLEKLCSAADEIRERRCGNGFDICSVINGKSGNCPENCRFCSQSACSRAVFNKYPFRDPEEIEKDALHHYEKGIKRYCIVASGKRLSDRDIDKACEAVRYITTHTRMHVCTSFGLLSEEQFTRLREAGVTRIHNNLETSRSHFTDVCTSHTYDEKIATVKAAKAAGMEICCGGIININETMKDRIDMAFDIRELDVQSVPVNVLSPVKGTDFGDQPPLSENDITRTFAIFRFILPDVSLRFAAGRGTMHDLGKNIFRSGCNAAITGDMVTVGGISHETDFAMVKGLGYTVKTLNDFEQS